MHNDRGDTESGAYPLHGAFKGIFTAAPDARFWIPREDEWYKAAYYDPQKNGEGGYWRFPNRSDQVISNLPGETGAANYFPGTFERSLAAGNMLTSVNAYPASPGPFGTFDQGGNVAEWIDARVVGDGRVLRGGSWQQSANAMDSLNRDFERSSLAAYYIGFRLAAFC
jgi:formylglycine-generating enzyme required for sulfatase activity